ncbi:hypothetical protein BO99DRAFT_410604 [Aspergillus violaceofuscus CBS 115571]|uniref:Uncharacterized protein n=1 Tax=Aspergillus violaceofuscus (strain CBS 115571) TaxID=1450538 RepID=A0A2V5IP45_ASPV1|nr:hypothetical protein BO99DRAFT_410604 [Aspergillus violaceofuscus CBS 115571]
MFPQAWSKITRRTKSKRGSQRPAIAVESKRPRYVEMLESDRQRLIDGLQKLYRYTSGACPRDSVILPPSGQEQPLVHEILSRLHVLPAESESQKPPCQRSSTETTIDSSATDTFNMIISSGSLCEDGAMSPPPPAGIDIPMTEPLWSMLDSGYTVRNQDLVTISDAMTNSKVLQAWEEWPMQMATGHLFSTTFSLDNGFMDETQWLPYNAITDWMGLT